MATEPAKAPQEPSQQALKAWGQALISTGTKFLDLGMVRQGRKALAEAEAMTPPAPPES